MYLTNIEKKIPLNDKNFFIIKKNKWNYSIDIIFTDSLNFNNKNLFLILKSYFLTDRVYVSSMYYILSNLENSDIFFTYRKINNKKIIKMSFSEFFLWFDDFLEIDKEYIKSYEFHGFRIIFHSNSITEEENLIYPIYPWKDELYNIYFKEKEVLYKIEKNIDYKIKYYKLLNTILKNERLRYRSLPWKRKK